MIDLFLSSGKDHNSWNPIHQENQETFEKDDLAHLLLKHNDMMEERDKKRHADFKTYELGKEHKRREELKKMSKDEREAEEAKKKPPKQHDKLHEPGHKAQLEEVWEKEDGLDPDSFDPKTFFNLHDKNSDGYLDRFELETLFLSDLDKAYNESDPDTDIYERNEDSERMREHVIKNIDNDKDGLVSIEEFIKGTYSEDFEKDEEWKPIVDEEQFTDDDITEYERMIAEEGGEEVHEEIYEEEVARKNTTFDQPRTGSIEHHTKEVTKETEKHDGGDRSENAHKEEETKSAEEEVFSHDGNSENAHTEEVKVKESHEEKPKHEDSKEDLYGDQKEEQKEKAKKEVKELVPVTDVDHETLDGAAQNEEHSEKEVVKNEEVKVNVESTQDEEVVKKDEQDNAVEQNKAQTEEDDNEKNPKEQVAVEQTPPKEEAVQKTPNEVTSKEPQGTPSENAEKDNEVKEANPDEKISETVVNKDNENQVNRDPEKTESVIQEITEDNLKEGQEKKSTASIETKEEYKEKNKDPQEHDADKTIKDENSDPEKQESGTTKENIEVQKESVVT